MSTDEGWSVEAVQAAPAAPIGPMAPRRPWARHPMGRTGADMIDERGFCYVEPAGPATDPVVDGLTRRATALLRAGHDPGPRYRGTHSCTGCWDAQSDNADHVLPDGRKTHSLLVHYVACHRAEVPAWDLDFLARLREEAEPTDLELGSTRPRVVLEGPGRELPGRRWDVTIRDWVRDPALP